MAWKELSLNSNDFSHGDYTYVLHLSSKIIPGYENSTSDYLSFAIL